MLYSCSNFLCLSLSVSVSFLALLCRYHKRRCDVARPLVIYDTIDLTNSLSLCVRVCAENCNNINHQKRYLDSSVFFCRSSRPAAEDDLSPPAPPAQPGLPPSQPAAASLLLRLVKRANQNESQQESGKKLGRNNNLSRLKILYED